MATPTPDAPLLPEEFLAELDAVADRALELARKADQRTANLSGPDGLAAASLALSLAAGAKLLVTALRAGEL